MLINWHVRSSTIQFSIMTWCIRIEYNGTIFELVSNAIHPKWGLIAKPQQFSYYLKITPSICQFVLDLVEEKSGICMHKQNRSTILFELRHKTRTDMSMLHCITALRQICAKNFWLAIRLLSCIFGWKFKCYVRMCSTLDMHRYRDTAQSATTGRNSGNQNGNRQLIYLWISFANYVQNSTCVKIEEPSFRVYVHRFRGTHISMFHRSENGRRNAVLCQDHT